MAKFKTVQNLSGDFIVSPGSQVVLTVKKTMTPKGEHVGSEFETKKPGTVGSVIKSPPTNAQPYLVQFTDHSVAEVFYHEMVLRRQEIDIQLLDERTDFRPYIIYRCQVGSKAYGLSHSESDDDIRGIYLPPAEFHWSLYQIPEQIEGDGETDEVYWEIEKYVRLALKANPNILETLWTPIVLQTTPIVEELRSIRHIFLTKHIYKTYSGYVLSQFRRMKNRFEKTGEYKLKHAMHLLRLLYSGISALKTGEIMIDVSDHRAMLLEVREGKFSFEDVRKKALELDREFQAAFEKSELPDQPDFDVANQFLVSARRSKV